MLIEKTKTGWKLNAKTHSHNGQPQNVTGCIQDGVAYMTANHGGLEELTNYRRMQMTGARRQFANFLLEQLEKE